MLPTSTSVLAWYSLNAIRVPTICAVTALDSPEGQYYDNAVSQIGGLSGLFERVLRLSD